MRKKKAELIPTISLEHGEGEVVGVYLPMERMSKTMAEGKEDLERAFNIMNEELLKAEYKERHRIAQQKYREKNKDILRAKSKIYRENNKDKIRARNKVWQENKRREQKNKDKLIEELKRKVDSQLSLLNTTRTILVNTVAENKKLREERDFFYKSAKQFREQIERWEKDFVEGRIVEKD